MISCEKPKDNLTKSNNKTKELDLLRFITCGSVDDGKSTLIGRMLWETKQIFDDQLDSLKKDSRKYQKNDDSIDFSLLVDGLTAEREQGITIDVAYRYFTTAKRRFIVADSPGHEQYTRNMATAASNADLAIILVDATKGILQQTRRHAYLCALMGIKHIILAINKMDLVNFAEAQFNLIKDNFETAVFQLNFESITAIPLSASHGDNIVMNSENTPWFKGAPLLKCLETIKISRTESKRLVFPVQWVNRPNAEFRGFAGTIAEGRMTVGDEVRNTRTGQQANIQRIVTMDGDLTQAQALDAVTITLDTEIDVSRGDVLSFSHKPLEMTDQFEATLVWMDQTKGVVNGNYLLKSSSQETAVTLTEIKYRMNMHTQAQEMTECLNLNDICRCHLSTIKPLTFDSFQNSKCLGAFILIDRHSNLTVAAGVIHHSLNRSQNVFRQAFSIMQQDRERLKGHKGKVLWFTGLSGSGKSTIANALEIQLHQQNFHTYLLDGDNVRQGLNKDLGFSVEDRVENIRRVAEVAKLMMDAGLLVITTFISPFEHERAMAKELIGADNFVEIFINTPLDVCESRDTKGLYQNARAGKISNMSGISSPYEVPKQPDIEIQGAGMSVEEAVNKILNTLPR